jgi:hypothetical protein
LRRDGDAKPVSSQRSYHSRKCAAANRRKPLYFK